MPMIVCTVRHPCLSEMHRSRMWPNPPMPLSVSCAAHDFATGEQAPSCVRWRRFSFGPFCTQILSCHFRMSASPST